jgi:hypothetical protein
MPTTQTSASTTPAVVATATKTANAPTAASVVVRLAVRSRSGTAVSQPALAATMPSANSATHSGHWYRFRSMYEVVAVVRQHQPNQERRDGHRGGEDQQVPHADLALPGRLAAWCRRLTQPTG